MSYDAGFYSSLVESSGQSAKVIVPLVLELAAIGSVLDVGCGVGSFLAAFADAGVSDIAGIDRDEVPENLLQIPAAAVGRVDLARPFDLGRRFDLVVSVEVAEHLPEASAPGFVRSIAAHTDLVLFSAAIPGQGGNSHINEQWPRYWVELFASHGFVAVDAIRPLIWDRGDVQFWYAQNCLLYARGSAIESLGDVADGTIRMLDVVHPRLWTMPTPPVGLRDLARQVPGTARRTLDHYRRRLMGR